MLHYISKSIVFACSLFLMFGFAQTPELVKKELKTEIISHVQVKKHPTNYNVTLVRFALHYDVRVTVFLQKRGSSALIQLRKTADLKKGVKTLKVDRTQYPASNYQLVIKAGKASKVIDYTL